MTFSRKTTQAVTVLLVFLMGTMLVLPPGMDLAFCFGKDGHIDVSLNGCQKAASPKSPVREVPSVYDTPHHGDCLDITVACNRTEQFVRSGGKSDAFSYKSTLKKDPSGSPFLPSEFLAASAGAFRGLKAHPVFPEDIPPYQLVFSRTVVLLI